MPYGTQTTATPTAYQKYVKLAEEPITSFPPVVKAAAIAAGFATESRGFMVNSLGQPYCSGNIIARLSTSQLDGQLSRGEIVKRFSEWGSAKSWLAKYAAKTGLELCISEIAASV